MLERVAQAYEEEVDATVESLTSMIEPILIVLLAGLVGCIVIGLFLPLLKIALVWSGSP
jgi:type IV pilus assembly protein PilC